MTIEEIKKRLEEILALLTEPDNDATLDDATVTALEEEVRSLSATLNEADMREQRTAIADAINAGLLRAQSVGGGKKTSANEMRGKDLREGRSVTVASSDILLPSHASTDIRQPFEQVSGLLDLITVDTIEGGESYAVPYEISSADGGYTAEGAAATTADTTFGYATIGKTKITAYSEVAEEVLKLSDADYDARIVRGIETSTKRKMINEILIGDGSAGHFTGIFSAEADAISVASDIELAEIDNTTLDTIIYAYGGDEAIEGDAVLILQKSDLAAFAKLRNTDGGKLHTIVNLGGKGTIDGVPFVITSAVPGVLSSANTIAGTYCMAYGNPRNYTVGVFSPLEIKKSTDYKFKEGFVCNKGAIFCGGNVTAHNGFVRVKKS